MKDGTKHFVRWRNGDEIGPDDHPTTWSWGNGGIDCDIVAYRVVGEQK